jgi:hypothetical protein
MKNQNQKKLFYYLLFLSFTFLKVFADGITRGVACVAYVAFLAFEASVPTFAFLGIEAFGLG